MTLFVLVVAAAVAFGVARWGQKLPGAPSLPNEYALYAAAAAAATGGFAALLATWAGLSPILLYAAAALTAAGAAWHGRKLRREQRRVRVGYEALFTLALAMSAAAAVVTTAGIIFAVAAESWLFFRHVSPVEFLFGLEWSPQIAIREDQAGARGAFGFIPLIAGTLLISMVAMAVAVPMGLATALYLSEFASARTRDRVKPCMEMLAGVPTVVYGFFAVVTLSPILKDLGASLGVDIAGESALAAGLVMGMMLIPFIASLSEDALFAVPASLREGALALGSTPFEAAAKVVMPAALPGIAAGMLLALSRAIGETMIVVMAAGVAANLSANPLEAVTTVTVQIVTLLTGDQEFDDPKTLAAFALGLALFFITLLINVAALHLVRKFRQRYD